MKLLICAGANFGVCTRNIKLRIATNVFGGLWNSKLLAGVLALVACAVSAPLPMGLMPKVAGPCGRDLCYCHDFQVSPPGERTQPSAVPQVLTLEGQALSAAGAPGTAFELVSSGSEIPQPASFPVFEENTKAQHINTPLTCRPSHVCDIILPPPRA